jgi:putative membrane protein
MKFFWRILAAILGLFLAQKFISGVEITLIPGKSNYFGINFAQEWQMIIFLGFILGLLNIFLKPILDLISLPLKILTFGLFSLILNVILVWILEIFFPELKFLTISSLFLTGLIIWILEILLK